MKSSQMCGEKGREMIVLARLVKDYKPSETEFEQRDRNWIPKMVEVSVPAAHIWCRKEKPGDMERAKLFAAEEGYTVFIYPNSERKPLERAKKEVQQ